MSWLRSFFIALSQNRRLRRFGERTWAGRRLSSRFVAGMEIEDALRVAEAMNRLGILVTLDALGESVSNEAEAQHAAAVYHRLLDQIEARKLRANVSLKLTQMGLEFSPEIAECITADIVRHAAQVGSFVRIDMEGSNLTEVTLQVVRRLHAQSELQGAVGVVLQAYLYRTQADLEHLLAEGIRVRLCKGAYKESPTVAFAEKRDVDANYVRLVCKLLESPVYHGLATHDESMLRAAIQYAEQHHVDPSRFEFQMLFGIRRDLQRRLVRQGYNVRVYIPFGREWYPYFMRRIAERPANLFFVLRNLFYN